MKQKIRLTESDLHRIVKESVNRIISENGLNDPIDGNLDIPSYEDPNELFSNYEIPNRTEKFNKIMRGYSKMPKGYDRSIDPDSDAADRISMMNKSYESEAFPYLKDAENDASWNAYDRELERERNEMEHKYGSGAEDWLYNESVIRRATKESVNNILRESDWDSGWRDEKGRKIKEKPTEETKKLARSFLNWVDSGECNWCGKPTYAWEGMCDYYTQDIGGKLYIASEAFAESYGKDVDEVFEAAKYATKMFFRQNPREAERVREEFYDKMGYARPNKNQELLTKLFMPRRK